MKFQEGNKRIFSVVTVALNERCLQGVGKMRDAGVLTGKKREINCGEKCGTAGNLRVYTL